MDQLLRDIGQFEEDSDEAEPGNAAAVHRPATGQTNGGPSRQMATRRGSVPSRHSTEDGAEEDSDDDADGDETTGLTAPSTRRKGQSLLSARRKSMPHQHAATDMTASTELTRSMRRMSTGYEDYEHAVIFSSGIMLKKRIIGLYVQLCELKSYVQLNKTGFRKVLKKFDKILGRKYRALYMDNFVEPAYPFQEDTVRGVEENIHKMEKAYTEVVMNGDEEAAKKDLRSHLREHVVWERNTVWRDLIGIERRAEAASLGRALLGRGDGAVRMRRHGDDDDSPETKTVSTPIGRFTCPVWLFSSAMFTLLINITIFFAILFVPIMEKPEQQNCLAMLVFVSLMWATEVSWASLCENCPKMTDQKPRRYRYSSRP